MSDKPVQEYGENSDKSMNDEDEDEMEDMDGRAKALTNLLKTSSVSTALEGDEHVLQLMTVRRSSLL